MNTKPADSLDAGFFRLLCEHLGIALIATDADHRIRFWNAAAGRMFGATATAMVSTSAMAIFPQDRRSLAEQLLRRALVTGETTDFDFKMTDPQGVHREYSTTVEPIVSSAGAPLGASLCVQDITRPIAEVRNSMESSKMAALVEMAGAIAHHFNNILGGAITGMDYATSTDDPAVKDRILQQTSRALLRASALVNQLLAVAEGDRRCEDLSDLTEILIEIADDVEREAAAQGVTFLLHKAALPVLPVPRRQLATVLRNIIRNALEAMPNGGTLTLEASVKENNVVLRITDTGRGMDPDTLARIFEPFFGTKGLAAAGTATVTGLGLAIAEGLIRVLGGMITATSKPNEGTCFTVTLPRPACA